MSIPKLFTNIFIGSMNTVFSVNKVSNKGSPIKVSVLYRNLGANLFLSRLCLLIVTFYLLL